MVGFVVSISAAVVVPLLGYVGSIAIGVAVEPGVVVVWQALVLICVEYHGYLENMS